MPRLTDKQWNLVKADYTVNGMSYTQLSDKYNVDKAAISRKAKSEAWTKAKNQQVVDKKVNALIELNECQLQTQQMTIEEQLKVEDSVKHELVMKGINQNFEQTLMGKAVDIARGIDVQEDDYAAGKVVQLSSAYKNMNSHKNPQQTVINNTNAQQNIQPIISDDFKQQITELL